MPGLQDHFMFRSHLCISFELLAINLYDFLRLNHFRGLSMGLIRRFAHQVLVALQFMKVGGCSVCRRQCLVQCMKGQCLVLCCGDRFPAP